MDEKWGKMQNPEHFREENKHLYQYRSSCTGTHGKKRGSVQLVPVQVEHVPVHPSSEQPVPIQVKVVLVQVVPAALF